MFRPTKDDCLYTLENVFIGIEENGNVFILSFAHSDKENSKKVIRWDFEKRDTPIDIGYVPYKFPNDAVRAKDVCSFFQENKIDVYFWHEAISYFDPIKDFYLQKIKPNVYKALERETNKEKKWKN